MTPHPKAPRPRSWLKQAETILFNIFLIWSGVGLLTLAFKIHPLPPWIRWADAFFIVLATANAFLAIARRDGWPTTWASFGIVAVVSGSVEFFGAQTGWPFGPYEYLSDRFGWRIAGVLPFTIPLAWFTILACGHYFASLIFPARPRLLCALVTAAYATALDFVMEPFAWFVKAYWQWNAAAVPWQNYASWFVLSFALSAVCPWGRRPLDRFDPRPAWIAGSMLLTFAVGRVAHGV